MNDPNGLVFHDGEYHLFYQHNPFGDTWGHMSWGHAVSPDLLHWSHLPVALREDQEGMVFSGSAVVDWTNTSGLAGRDSARPCPIAVYTGHSPGRQTQNLAYSNDRGRTWTKYAGNPVVDLGLAAFRDPKVFWHAATGRWIMLTVLADRHVVRFFSSPDLKHWDVLSDFGPEGAAGGVWECPDLFALGVEDEPSVSRWVLSVDLNPGGTAGGSGGQYFVGAFDGTRFVNEHPAGVPLWVDHGRDFYASLSYSDIPARDGRRIWIGWMSNWAYANQEPTSPWRGVQSVPRALALRRLPEGIRLVQRPVAELETLRVSAEPEAVKGSMPLPPAADIAFEVTPGPWREAGLSLRNSAGERVEIGVAQDPLHAFVDRRNSRLTPFHESYPERHSGPVRWRNGRVSMRILTDATTVEVFANAGETVISDRLHPTHPFETVEMLDGGVGHPSPPRMWTLRPAG